MGRPEDLALACTRVLQLEGWEVVFQQREEGQRIWRFTLLPQHSVAVCPHCGKLTNEVHDTRDRDDVHDLPIGEYRVLLRLRVFRFECLSCERTFTPPSASVAEGSHATERFLERCAELIRTADIANAAAFFHLPEKTLERWYYAYVQRRQRQPQSLQPITSIGIDELSLKKGTAVSSRS
jgi:transposase